MVLQGLPLKAKNECKQPHTSVGVALSKGSPVAVKAIFHSKTRAKEHLCVAAFRLQAMSKSEVTDSAGLDDCLDWSDASLLANRNSYSQWG
jgi:hypothetical protein